MSSPSPIWWWTRTTAQTPDETKACCAAAYESDIVALLLGDSYHPGGLALTRALVTRLGLAPDAHVLDLASGRGATTVLLAQDFGLRVAGLDLSAANVSLAQGRADAAGLAGSASFTVGDAERLPFPNTTFDAVVVECALCTFPDKCAAASEVARVLRPGGKLGLTDVLVDRSRLPAELTTLGARIACVADALPLRAYADLLYDAGLQVTHTERHDTAVTRMIDQVEARLAVLRLTAGARLEEIGLDVDRARSVLSTARAAVNDGTLGYGLLVAEKPT